MKPKSSKQTPNSILARMGLPKTLRKKLREQQQKRKQQKELEPKDWKKIKILVPPYTGAFIKGKTHAFFKLVFRPSSSLLTRATTGISLDKYPNRPLIVVFNLKTGKVEGVNGSPKYFPNKNFSGLHPEDARNLEKILFEVLKEKRGPVRSFISQHGVNLY